MMDRLKRAQLIEALTGKLFLSQYDACQDLAPSPRAAE